MTLAYYSAVLAAPVGKVWAAARDFGDYRLFTAGRGEAFIEDGKRGDCIGAIRNATLEGRTIRQRLLGHSDLERCYTYEFCGPAPLPIENYVATLQVRPIVRTGETFLEWRASFECALEQREAIRRQLEASFAVWVDSLSAAIG